VFVTKVFHPNIGTSHQYGGYPICIDILQDHWTSAYTISQIMLSISSLLTDPNPSSPMNRESAKLWETNKEEYNRVVKQWVKKYASPESLS
jgi:ubiquitin-conjugating enzyme E2 D/E